MRPLRDKRIAWRGGLAMLAGLILAALAFGVPEQGGCGGIPEEDGGAVEGALTGRLAAPARLLIIWDLPDGTAYKAGDGTVSGGSYSLSLKAPPDAVLADLPAGVAQLVAVPASLQIADGPVDADFLAQSALGVLSGTAVVYKAGESSSYPWLSAFRPGISCARVQPPLPGARMAGGAPLAGYAPAACRGLSASLAPIAEPAFANWSLPQAAPKVPAPLH